MAGKTRNGVILSFTALLVIIALSTSGWKRAEFLVDNTVVTMHATLREVHVDDGPNNILGQDSYDFQNCGDFPVIGDQNRCSELSRASDSALAFGILGLFALIFTIVLVYGTRCFNIPYSVELLELAGTLISCVFLLLSWSCYAYLAPAALPQSFGAPQSLHYSLWLMFVAFLTCLITFLHRFVEVNNDSQDHLAGITCMHDTGFVALSCMLCAPLYSMSRCMRHDDCLDACACFWCIPIYATYNCYKEVVTAGVESSTRESARGEGAGPRSNHQARERHSSRDTKESEHELRELKRNGGDIRRGGGGGGGPGGRNGSQTREQGWN